MALGPVTHVPNVILEFLQLFPLPDQLLYVKVELSEVLVIFE